MVTKILKILVQEFPEAKSELKYRNTFEFVISVILSAQCTDKRVNQESPKLFAKWPTPKALAKANPKEVENRLSSHRLGNGSFPTDRNIQPRRR